jgi:hypothetical protein
MVWNGTCYWAAHKLIIFWDSLLDNFLYCMPVQYAVRLPVNDLHSLCEEDNMLQ